MCSCTSEWDLFYDADKSYFLLIFLLDTINPDPSSFLVMIFLIETVHSRWIKLWRSYIASFHCLPPSKNSTCCYGSSRSLSHTEKRLITFNMRLPLLDRIKQRAVGLLWSLWDHLLYLRTKTRGKSNMALVQYTTVWSPSSQLPDAFPIHRSPVNCIPSVTDSVSPSSCYLHLCCLLASSASTCLSDEHNTSTGAPLSTLLVHRILMEKADRSSYFWFL